MSVSAFVLDGIWLLGTEQLKATTFGGSVLPKQNIITVNQDWLTLTLGTQKTTAQLSLNKAIEKNMSDIFKHLITECLMLLP